MGRIGHFIEILSGSDGPQIMLERAKLANALLFTLRGGPVLYYGDEKGMTGGGGDQMARQDMFVTQVEDWKSEVRIGSNPIGNSSAFDVKNPLEANIAELQGLYKKYPALKSGAQQVRYGLGSVFAVSRFADNQEFLIAFNSNDDSQEATVPVSTKDSTWMAISGGAQVNTHTSTIDLKLAPRSWVILKADKAFEPSSRLAITLNTPKPDYRTPGWSAITAKVPGDDFVQVTFAARQSGKTWKVLGTSDHRTTKDDYVVAGLHRVFIHNRLYKSGTTFDLVAVVTNSKGEKSVSKVIKYTIKY